ncbi:MAG: ATP-binding protein [Bacteroidota bacterium]|nr:ATP-binding protein [Bacteroidota bacterium]
MNQYIAQIEHDLRERLKELECLYSISSLLDENEDIPAVLRKAAAILRQAVQYPDIAVTKIRIENDEYADGETEGREIVREATADIFIKFTARGSVSVGYVEDRPFLKEEQQLVHEIGRMLSKALERRHLEEQLKLYVGDLEELVKEKTSEVALRRKHFEDLFMYAPDGVVISRSNGDIVKANPSFYRMLQYPEDGSVQLNFVRDKLYQDIPRVRPYIYSVLDEKGFLEGFEMTLIDRAGNPVPVIGSFIYIDIDGERCVESIYKDIRYRKAIEQQLIEQKENLEQIVRQRTADLEKRKDQLVKKNRELVRLTHECRESRERLQTLFNAITDVVLMLDPDRTIRMANKPDIPVGGKCYQEVFHRPTPCAQCPGMRVVDEKAPIAAEHREGDRCYHLHAYPIFGVDRNVTGYIEFIRDVTAEKNLEQQLIQADKLASLGQLVSGIAHEINNPNTFIRGNISIIEEAFRDILPILDRVAAEKPDLKIARLKYAVFRENIPVLVQDMLQGSNRIKSIVDGLREYARKDEGILNENVDLNAVIERSLRLVQNQIKRTARVTFEPERSLPAIRGNFQKLEQVVINMLINASQAIDKEKGDITITTRYRPEAGEVAVLISDNGKGMDENTKRQIFDPFFTTKRTQGGTGLGLSIAQRIIREHGGRIEVESQPRLGTTFFIYLPVSDGTKP